MSDSLTELVLRVEELEAWRQDQEKRSLALEEADKAHDARLGHHSDRAKKDELTTAVAFTMARDAQHSVHDIEETYSDPERAILAVTRKIAGENSEQTKMLKWGRWLLLVTPFAVLLSEVIHACSDH